MTNQIRKPELWVDELREKHECGGYDGYSLTTELVLDGRRIMLRHPFSLEAAEFLSVTKSDSGELLYLIVRQPRPHGYFPNAAIMIVAKRREADNYAAVVWHELYPWAFKYLGLAGEIET
jgi:hypothetical protein